MSKELSEMNEKDALEVVKGMTIEDMMIEVLSSQKQVKASQEAIKKDVEEVRSLAIEIDKKVHIDDVEASEIKSIISRQSYEFAKEYFDNRKVVPSANLFASKKGQFIRVQHSRLKHHFNVTKYTHIKHTEAEKAISYLKSLSYNLFTPFETRETPKQKEIIELENKNNGGDVA
ncbi:TPA: hypothetical protein ACJRXT_002077 [Streptococcus agalactiae]|uniref:hypothetical protein n=1 Tax=Streptococcus agalactiae TaxID=1311 RepID=UPI0038772861